MDNIFLILGILALVIIVWGGMALKYEIWNRKQDKLPRPVTEADTEPVTPTSPVKPDK